MYSISARFEHTKIKRMLYDAIYIVVNFFTWYLPSPILPVTMRDGVASTFGN